MKKLAFGCMRLPMKNQEVDMVEFNHMVDIFLEKGFTYFDTAHGYLDGKSEIALREGLVDRYDRADYVLANKLSEPYFECEEDIRLFFEKQLEICGVDYFDYYLMHAQNAKNYLKYQRCHAYEIAQELKKKGKIRHVGLSFHDRAEVLDQILNDHPEIEFVQIQFNYLDYHHDTVQSRLCYEVCRKHQKKVMVMEPVKGGRLVHLPADAQKMIDELNGGSNASYAIRFAASFEGVIMVLSGMSDLTQMKDNISFMDDFKPLNEVEMNTLYKVGDMIRELKEIACTECRYCVKGCPKNILIPDLFQAMNMKTQLQDWDSLNYYKEAIKNHGLASDCIQCGKCESICPQKLPIRDLLKKVGNTFEKNNE